MRLNYKNTTFKISLCGAAGLSLFSGCGPKEEVVAVPTNETVIVKNPTPAPGKITIENKPVVIEKATTPPVRTETKTTTKVTDKKPSATKAPTKAPTTAPTLPEPAETKEPVKTTTKTTTKTTAKLVPIPEVATRMIVEDIKVGSGAAAQPGNKVSVHYTGTLTDGTEFDSSVGKAPFNFTLGIGNVIQGWDNGVVGMKVGGKRRLIIPADMAYGAKNQPGIPPNSTLVFIVELLEVQ
jgi:FKBP-type peptidyl-prolyl cis-trans isomerase